MLTEKLLIMMIMKHPLCIVFVIGVSVDGVVCEYNIESLSLYWISAAADESIEFSRNNPPDLPPPTIANDIKSFCVRKGFSCEFLAGSNGANVDMVWNNDGGADAVDVAALPESRSPLPVSNPLMLMLLIDVDSVREG